MEVLVVADESMANFHGKSIRKYILTIMAEVGLQNVKTLLTLQMIENL